MGVNSIAENATSPVTGTFTVTAPDGLKEISVKGTVVTAVQLADLTVNKVVIAGTEGTLTLTGFDPTTGVVSYGYQQTGTNKDHSSGKDKVTDSFEVIVTDSGGDSTIPQDLVILITDTAPVAKPDTNQVTEDSTTPATGNVITDAGDGKDVLGADAVTVTGVVKGTNTTELSGSVGNNVPGDFGTLKLNANGSYTYDLDNTNPTVNALKTLETLTDTFSYTIKDADGDWSTTTVTITIKGNTDGVPGLVIEDKNDADVGVNSIAENATSPVTGTFTVTAPDGLKEISVRGATVTAAQLADLAANPVVIPGTEGTLTLTGFDSTTGIVTYSYQQSGTNKNHSGGKNSVTDNFEVIVTDSGGASTTPQDLVILITDTAPVAKPDTNQVTEDSTTPATGSVITDAGDGKDVLGADAVTVTGVVKGTNTTELSGSVGNNVPGDFGTLKLNANGSYSYELDNSNPIVNALKTGETQTDTFSYTIKDTDGDLSTTTITITINGVTDGEPTITPVDGNDSLGGIAAQGQATVYESGLTTDGPAGQSKTTIGEITVTADNGLVSVTVGGKTLTLDELNALSGTPTAIITDYGKITLTGFTPDVTGGITVGGKISYTYELTKPYDNADPGDDWDRNNFDKIDLKVTDAGGADSTGTLDINIIDDAPSIGKPESGEVDEAGLPGGSEAGKADISVTGKLDVRVGADNTTDDGVADVRFAATQKDLAALGLSSGYDNNDPIPLKYVVSDDGYTLIAYKGDGLNEADKVFTVVINDPNSSEAGYTFTLHKPLNHEGKESLDLPFDFSVVDGDNDRDNSQFTIKIKDDSPPASGKYELNIVEDSKAGTVENTFNTSADANPGNTVISVAGGVPLDVTDDGNGGKTYTYPDGHTGAQDFYGSVTVNANGSITYVPDENYSNPGSPDSFTYTTTNGTDVDTVKVTVNVKPVADAPDLEKNKVLITPEDTPRSLELKAPVVTDKIQVPGATATTDYPERLGEITLTLIGTAIGTLTNADGSTTYKNTGVDGIYKFVITGVADLHLNGLTTAGDATVNYVTKAEYEAIKALPAADRHENFEVVVSVDSYEVDVNGDPLPGIDPAKSTQTITVDVHAVTDDVGLKVKEVVAQAGVKVVISDDGADEDKIANITFDEDTSFNLTNILAPEAFKDTDGSETRYLGLKGLPAGSTVTVGGVDYIIGESNIPTVNFGGSIGNIPALTILGTETDLPQVAIKPPKDFSGDLTGIQIVLGALDSDLDSTGATPTPLTDEVTINLHVKPVAGDLDIKGVTGNEDTAIAFLSGVKVTDTSTKDETLGEVITKVSFKLPEEWTPADSGKNWTNTAGQVWTLAEPTGADAPATGKYTVSFEAGEYVITFDASSTLTREEREEILGKFTLTPPAHSSKDVTLDINVTSKDFSVISDGDPSAEEEVSGPLKVTVKPVAERADSSTNDGSTDPADFDVTLNPDYVYTKQGAEDEAFSLGIDGSFNLSAGWSNEDGKWVRTGENWAENTDNGRSEDTFALLTPYTTVGNNAQATAAVKDMLEGSVFTYSDGTTTFSLPFAGEPVKIPMQYLDSVTFTGPKDWAGVVKIKVQAGTVDYDEDAPNAPTGMTTSGEAWLTNLVIAPKADQVTLKVDAIITTLEDKKTTLKINPTTTDASETFNVTIKGITLGSKILYKGVTYTAEGESPTGLTKEVDGTYTLKIVNFDKTQQPELTPPKDSNATINLTVTAETVDTLTYIDSAGATQTIIATDPSKNQTLPIEVKVQGVPDTPVLDVAELQTYIEDAGDQADGQLKVDLQDLITSFKSGETGVDGGGPDGSETVTLRLSDLPEGFTLEGARPSLGGSGLTRVWVISESDLANVKIIVPKHYSGTVDFTAQPVVTEIDNPSEVFFNPSYSRALT